MNDQFKNDVEDLFNKIDKNKDGKIDFSELNEYVKRLSVDEAKSVQYSEKIFEEINKLSRNNKKEHDVQFDFRRSIDFCQFMDYIIETDKKIILVFKQLDDDKNGLIDKKEI